MLSVLSVMSGLNNVVETFGMSQSGDGHIHKQEVLESMLKTEVSNSHAVFMHIVHLYIYANCAMLCVV